MRIRKYILESEAKCRCGCGLVSSDGWLDAVNLLIVTVGFSIPISTMVRCPKYNKRIGGVSDSPHLEFDGDLGAADLKCRNPAKRMEILVVAFLMKAMGMINQIECADKHIHIANVPSGHRLEDLFNWGKSK